MPTPSSKKVAASDALKTDGRHSLAEAVYQAFLERIIRGTLTPGTVLSAVQWAEKFQVSRTPVQEALRMLTAHGLVQNPAGRRAQVADFTKDDLWEIFEMRRLLEGRAAELAAGRMDDRQLGPLLATAGALSNRDDDWTADWADFDEDFHATIAACSGNGRLANDIERYRQIHRGFNRVSTDLASLRTALSEHLDILTALGARDGDGAKKAMEAHIFKWQRYFVERF